MQAACIERLAALRPTFVITLERTAGLDRSAQVPCHSMRRSLASRIGVTLVRIDLSVGLADRVDPASISRTARSW